MVDEPRERPLGENTRWRCCWVVSHSPVADYFLRPVQPVQRVMLVLQSALMRRLMSCGFEVLLGETLQTLLYKVTDENVFITIQSTSVYSKCLCVDFVVVLFLHQLLFLVS